MEGGAGGMTPARAAWMEAIVVLLLATAVLIWLLFRQRMSRCPAAWPVCRRRRVLEPPEPIENRRRAARLRTTRVLFQQFENRL